MNALVSEMISTRAGQDVELRFLEDLLNDDCKCETRHRVTTCTFKVTGIVVPVCSDKPIMKCQSGMNHTVKLINSGTFCSWCGELASDCWEIRPI